MCMSNFCNVDGDGSGWCITIYEEMLEWLSFEKWGIHKFWMTSKTIVQN